MTHNFINTVLTLLVIGTATVTLQSCTESKGNDNKIPKVTEPIPVKVISLEKTTGSRVITTSGKLTTDDETLLSFKIGGVVDDVFVKEGDAVKKGQLLARLDLTEIKALVAQARLGVEKAERDFKRVQNLYADSVATLEQLQNAETGLAVAKKQLEATSFNQSYAEIHAPASGYVLNKFVNAGQVVGIGNPILKTNGAANGNWILKVGVSDQQWSLIQINDEATIQVEAFPGHPFTARVSHKSETSDPMTGAFEVELTLEHKNVKFASGMFASAEILSGKSSVTWEVPYEAVLDANDDKGFVFITNDDKKAIKVPVVIESFNGTNILIRKGLENAQKIIVVGSAYLTDQSPITIIH